MNEKFKTAACSLVQNVSDWFEINVEIRLFGVRVFSFTWPPKSKNLYLMETNNFVNACRPIVFRSFESSYSKFNRVEISKDGVLRPSFEFVEYSSKEDVSSSEYSLGNLIAIGAVNGMQYVSMSLNSDMNFVDAFAKSYQSITENV